VDTLQRAAAFYKDGETTGFDVVAKHVTDDFACLVEVESLAARIGGREDVTPVSLRVTTVFRLEDSAWRIVHRHADPITAPRQPESVLEQ
jgi:ketosteroid isomerase-like protein